MQKIIRRKIWPEFFAAVDSGVKPFEVRNDDRLDESFEVGDTLQLEEWDPSTKDYTGKIIRRVISYVLEIGGTMWGHNTVVLGLSSASPADRLPASRVLKDGEVAVDAMELTILEKLAGTLDAWYSGYEINRTITPKVLVAFRALRAQGKERS